MFEFLIIISLLFLVVLKFKPSLLVIILLLLVFSPSILSGIGYSILVSILYGLIAIYDYHRNLRIADEKLDNETKRYWELQEQANREFFDKYEDDDPEEFFDKLEKFREEEEDF